MRRRTIFVIGITAWFFIIHSILIPHDLYSQEGPAKAKKYDLILTEIEKLKNTDANLKKELEDMKSVAAGSGKKASAKRVKRAAGSKDEQLLLKASKLYFELGNSYTKAKLYRNAIDAYLLSLEADPQNAEAHYNLGLLYQHYQGDTNKAIIHFRKYLQSNPPPDRKREVQYLLGMLNSGREWVTSYY